MNTVSESRKIYGENKIEDFGEGDLVSYFCLGVKERQYGLIKKIYIDKNEGFSSAMALVLMKDSTPYISLANLRLESQAKRNKKQDE